MVEAFYEGTTDPSGRILASRLAFTPEIVVGVLDICNSQWHEYRQGEDLIGATKIAETACYFIFTYVGGLRGFEVPKVVIQHFRDQIEDNGFEGSEPFVGVPLVGHFKQRDGVVSNLIIFLVQKTSSGIQVGVWVRRLLDVLEERGITTGWLFQDRLGRAVPTNYFSDGFYTKLLELKETNPELFPPSVDVLEDFGPIRSGRRGADVQALKKVKNKNHIEMFFRWNTGGDETSQLPMHLLYAERRRMVKEFLLVSKAL